MTDTLRALSRLLCDAKETKIPFSSLHLFLNRVALLIKVMEPPLTAYFKKEKKITLHIS